MEDIDFNRRFGGVERLYGKKGLDRFKHAHVCVVGIGGVGSWAAEALGRNAIGKITLIDLDHIAESNINRQIHALTSTLGQSKVVAMKERILEINPMCEIQIVDDFISHDNIKTLITSHFDIVIDAIDQASIKTSLALHALSKKIPLVMTGGAGG
ncbi:MAG: ThiF family adenylyltransferase, partial [Candidatus Methylopumilus sp.]